MEQKCEEHYFSRNPKSRLIKTQVSFSFRQHTFSFLCASGVFSAKEIDFATALLLEHAQIQNGSNVLDLGCGIGIIGIAIKKVFPQCHVILSDVNKRACNISKKNAEKNEVLVEIADSDCYQAFSGKEFDTILTNPPHHAGRKVVYRIIEEAPLYLKSGGLLQLVAKHNKGGKMLQKKMEEVFGNAEIIGRKAGFCVYISKKK